MVAYIIARGQLNKDFFFYKSPFASENFVSQDGFGHPVLCQPVHFLHSKLNLVVNHGIIPVFRDDIRLYCQSLQMLSRLYWITQLRTDDILR